MKSIRREPLAVAAFVALGVVGIGLAISSLPADMTGKHMAGASNAASSDQRGFQRLFDEGVEYLRQGRTHEAVVIFHAAQKLDPSVPEVAVNLGFAYLARGEYEPARKHFERALGLKPDQVNAYYGLAQVLDAEGDIEGALGAMRTFMHLEKRDTPFSRKAEAAIWEMEDRLRRKREGTPNELPAGAVMLPDKVPARTFDDIRIDAPKPPRGQP